MIRSIAIRARLVRSGLALLAGLLSLCVVPAYAANDPLLARFVGDWVGRGVYRPWASAATEPLYCKVRNRLVDNGTALAQTGRCAIPDHSGPINGKITARGGGSYAGQLESFSTTGPALLAGKGAKDHIELVAQFIDRLSGQAGAAIFSLVVSGKDTYRLTSNMLDHDGMPVFIASDLVFTPQ